MLHHKHRDLFRCVALAKQIYDTHTAEAVSHAFVPVVSGYPLWVRFLAGKLPPSEVEGEMMAAVNALLNFVK